MPLAHHFSHLSFHFPGSAPAVARCSYQKHLLMSPGPVSLYNIGSHKRWLVICFYKLLLLGPTSRFISPGPVTLYHLVQQVYITLSYELYHPVLWVYHTVVWVYITQSYQFIASTWSYEYITQSYQFIAITWSYEYITWSYEFIAITRSYEFISPGAVSLYHRVHR